MGEAVNQGRMGSEPAWGDTFPPAPTADLLAGEAGLRAAVKQRIHDSKRLPAAWGEAAPTSGINTRQKRTGTLEKEGNK